MHALFAHICLLLALAAAQIATDSAQAQDLLNQEWLLDPALSSVYMVTAKANSIFETHQFYDRRRQCQLQRQCERQDRSGFDPFGP
jgi:hypothetical protein